MAYIYYYDKFFDNVYLAALAVFSAFVVVNVMVVKYLLARRNKKFVLLAVSFIAAGLSFLAGIWIGLICLSCIHACRIYVYAQPLLRKTRKQNEYGRGQG